MSLHDCFKNGSSWKVNHKPDGTFEVKFNGKVSMTEEKSLVYLGHVMSQDGKNLPNIIHKRTKTIGTQFTQFRSFQ